ncbi:hypothetical protein [Nocardia blacklockiae]|uniref:hypothetical protein n=1 Tax=Nocardia blacklockiae TaxID=480036 RepID=UPI0018934239|nr:hypothetical protein [Nocardia blacklockiae]MBF6171477.1 hypothetical protein [Nocardia blacklockiae]
MAQPAEPAVPQGITPSGRWYVLAAALAVAGIVGAMVIGVTSFVRLSDRVDGFQRVPIPGSSDVRIGDTGGYTMYFEYPNASAVAFRGSVNVRLLGPDGASIPLEDYSSALTYNFGGHEGRAGFSFDAPRPGTYHVVTQGDSGVTAAIGRGIGGSIGATVLLALGVGAAGVILGLVVLIVVAVRRGSSKRRIAAAAGWSYPAAPPRH